MKKLLLSLPFITLSYGSDLFTIENATKADIKFDASAMYSDYTGGHFSGFPFETSNLIGELGYPLDPATTRNITCNSLKSEFKSSDVRFHNFNLIFRLPFSSEMYFGAVGGITQGSKIKVVGNNDDSSYLISINDGKKLTHYKAVPNQGNRIWKADLVSSAPFSLKELALDTAHQSICHLGTTHLVGQLPEDLLNLLTEYSLYA